MANYRNNHFQPPNSSLQRLKRTTNATFKACLSNSYFIENKKKTTGETNICNLNSPTDVVVVLGNSCGKIKWPWKNLREMVSSRDS